MNFEDLLLNQLGTLIRSNIQVAINNQLIEGVLQSINGNWLYVLTSVIEYEQQTVLVTIPLQAVNYVKEL